MQATKGVTQQHINSLHAPVSHPTLATSQSANSAQSFWFARHLERHAVDGSGRIFIFYPQHHRARHRHADGSI